MFLLFSKTQRFLAKALVNPIRFLSLFGALLALTHSTQAAAPVITSTSAAYATAGVAFSFQVTATNAPTSFGASNLPLGLSINSSTGLISGTPKVSGSFSATLNARNGNGIGVQQSAWNVAAIRMASAGGQHSLFLKNDGSVWTSGRNESGQLGDGTKGDSKTPVQVIKDVQAVSAGKSHSLFLKTDGTVWACGNNTDYQLGDGSASNRSLPVQVMSGVQAISAGAYHSLFLKSDGSVWACGLNLFGALGDGTQIDRSKPVKVMTGVRAISAGSNFSLFLKNDGSAWSCGYNQSGQLGDGTTTMRSTAVPVLYGVQAISAGQTNSLFLMDDGTVWACGNNNYGQLGDGTTTERTTPVQIMTGVRAISAGAFHCLFLKIDETAWACGQNSSGQLGDATTINRTTSVQVMTGVQAISAGASHSLFMKADARVWACGANYYGQLGDGTTASRYSTVRSAMLDNLGVRVMAISTRGSHNLFLQNDGSAWACGMNNYGQLGNGTTTGRSTPVQVMTGVRAISAGDSHSLFLKLDGSAWACGYNDVGQLGDGTTVTRNIPVQVMTGVLAVSAGSSHSLFLKNDGSVWACGQNQYGRLGDGTTTSRTTPVQVMTDVSAISAGYQHSMFLKSNSTAWVCGSNSYEQLGVGGGVVTTPVQAMYGVQAISAGYLHSQFLKNDGTAWACGSNFKGRLGDGTTFNRSTPVQVMSGVEAVSAGIDHSHFLKIDGTLWTCGGNGSGQLGDGSTTDRSVPTQVLSGVQATMAGGYHSLFLKNDGSVWACGTNSSGQLSDGTAIQRNTPSPTFYSSRVPKVSAGNVSAVVGNPFSYQTMGTNSPVYYGASGLPSGLSVNANTGLISGAPTAVGTFNVTLSVGNAAGSGTEILQLTVVSPPPMINSAGTAMAVVGTGFSYQITASDSPTSYGAYGLPTGLSVNSNTGLITGTPTVGGISNVTLSATNAGGTGTKTLTITVNSAPVITSAGSAVTGVGQSFSYQITGSYSPTSYGATGLPAGLSVNSTTGLISGSPTIAGSSNVSVSATNSYGTGTKILALTVNPMPPVISSAGTATAVVGTTFSYQITASNSPTSFAASGLPAGLSVNSSTGLISGTPTVGGTSSVTLSATNTGGTGTKTLTLTVNSAPVIRGNSSFLAVLGQAFSYQIPENFSPISYGAIGLPAGLSVNAITGLISGMPTTIGTSNVTLSATNNYGTGIGTLQIVVVASAPRMAAGNTFTLLVNPNGTVIGYGDYSDGPVSSLANGERTFDSLRLLSGVFTVAASSDHALFLTKDGDVWACGYNYEGQLGDGTNTSRNAPVKVMSGVQAISAGGQHSLFLKMDGSVWASGSNNYGQLGNGTTTARSIPVQVMTGVRAISAGGQHSLFLKNDGGIWACGENFWGELGDGTVIDRLTPVQVMTSGRAIAAGISHSLFLKNDGSVWASGYGVFGDGDLGNLIMREVPVKVITGVEGISAGAGHSLFQKTDRTVWSLGSNHVGQLGDGTMTDRNAPVMVMAGVAEIKAGSSNSLFLKSDGSFWGCGSNELGQLAKMLDTDFPIPVPLHPDYPYQKPTSVKPSRVWIPDAKGEFVILSAIDADAWDRFTYTLVEGVGATNNSSFQIVGDRLQTTGLLYASRPTPVSVRIRTTDSTGKSTESVITLTAVPAKPYGRFVPRSQTFREAPCYVNTIFQLIDEEGRGINYPRQMLDGQNDLFSVTEDGTPVSPSESFMQISKLDELPAKLRTVLLLDNSNSVGSNLGTIKTSAKALVDRMTAQQEIAVYCFSGGSPVMLSDFKGRGEQGNIKSAIDGMTLGSPSTNLYGAVIEMLNLPKWVESYSLKGIETGFLVVLTDGGDTSGLATLNEVISMRDKLGKSIYAIGLGREFDPNDDKTKQNRASLNSLQNNGGYIEAPEIEQLYMAFQNIQDQIVDAANSFYWLNYASPKRGNFDRTLTVFLRNNLNANSDRVLKSTFNSNGFTDVQAGVMINRSANASSGVIRIEIGRNAQITANAFTMLGFKGTPRYKWTLANPELATLTILDADATQVAIAANSLDGVTKLTLTDTVNGLPSKTIDLVIGRPSSNASLKSLAISGAEIAPSFVSTTTAYTASVANTVSAISVTPTANHIAATIKINGVVVTSGKTSGNIALNVGSNIVNVEVTAENRVTVRKYTITINRAKSSDATLTALALSTGKLSPAFSKSVLSYSASVAKSVSTIKVKASASHAAAVIRINGIVVKSGAMSSPISLAVGKNTIRVVVTSQNGTVRRHFISVTRGAISAAPSALPSLGEIVLGKSESMIKTTVSIVRHKENIYRQLTINYPIGLPAPRIEVSGDLVQWSSGPRHTTVIDMAPGRMTVRDNTALVPGRKRFIRSRMDRTTTDHSSLPTSTVNPKFSSTKQ